MLEGMTVDHAAHVESLEIPQPGKLVATFPANAAFSLRQCEQPERKRELDQAIHAVTGQRVSLEFRLGTKAAVRPKQAPPPMANQRILTRDALSHPLVDEMRQLFDADIVRVIPPRSK